MPSNLKAWSIIKRQFGLFNDTLYYRSTQTTHACPDEGKRVLKNNHIPSANIYLDHRMIEERSYEFRKVKFKRIALNTNLYKI